MKMVDETMGEKTGTASGRPPERIGNGNPNGKSIGNTSLQTARRLEPYSPRRTHRKNYDDDSEEDNGRARSSYYGPKGSKQDTTSRMTSNMTGSPGTDDLNKPPVPPSLLPVQGNGEAFSVSEYDRVKREEIKLSIEFPLKNGSQGNDISLFLSGFYRLSWQLIKKYY